MEIIDGENIGEGNEKGLEEAYDDALEDMEEDMEEVGGNASLHNPYLVLVVRHSQRKNPLYLLIERMKILLGFLMHL